MAQERASENTECYSLLRPFFLFSAPPVMVVLVRFKGAFPLGCATGSTFWSPFGMGAREGIGGMFPPFLERGFVLVGEVERGGGLAVLVWDKNG